MRARGQVCGGEERSGAAAAACRKKMMHARGCGPSRGHMHQTESESRDATVANLSWSILFGSRLRVLQAGRRAPPDSRG
jgi:hypothetical protein